MITPRFNSQPVVPKHKRAAHAREIDSRLYLDAGFEELGESLDVKVAPGLVAHFDSGRKAFDEELMMAAQRREYFYQPLFESDNAQ